MTSSELTIQEAINFIRIVRSALKDDDPEYWREMIEDMDALISELEASLTQRNRVEKYHLSEAVKIVNTVVRLIIDVLNQGGS